MSNLNPQYEGKQFFKAKVGVLMQEYQRNKQEQLLQKQQLKQNIMLQIMNKRNKLPPTPTTHEKQEDKTSKTAVSDPTTEQAPVNNNINQSAVNQVQIKPHSGSAANSVPRNQNQKPVYEADEAQKFQQMTFNMKKRNKSLEEELKYKPSPEPEAKNNDEAQDSQEFAKSINRIAKYAKRYFPDTFQANEKFENLNSQNMKPEVEEQEQEEIEQKQYVNMINPSFLRADMSDIHGSHTFKKIEESKHYKPEQAEPEEPEHQEDQVEQFIEYDDNRGVFLTMEESESMTASELPKNVAYQIKMDKSADPDHLQELKRQKIKEMEKKRQQRIEQYRKQQSLKKVDHPKPRNSISSSRHEKHEKESEKEELPPKSTTIQRKSNMHRPPKMDNRSEREPISKNQPIPLDQYDQMKQSKASKNSYLALHENEIKQTGFKPSIQYEDPPPLPPHKPVSPFKTPKTGMSEQRSKSNHRSSNIFTGQSQQYHRQKSATRLDPKIQPKDRKNSFTRQSNKKLMVNAITYVCFPGELNRKDRERLVEVLESSQHEFFVFLFKEYSRKIIKGIYVLDNTQNRLERIYGDKAPPQITADRVQYFYRFDSGSRQFKKVDGCRSFSLAIHAIDLR